MDTRGLGTHGPQVVTLIKLFKSKKNRDSYEIGF